jgi:hypothetical protein
MSNDPESILKQTPLFEALTGEEIRGLARHVTRKKFQRGEHLFAEGDPCTGRSSCLVRTNFSPVLICMRPVRALGFLPSKVSMLCRSNDRIQAFFTESRVVFHRD